MGVEILTGLHSKGRLMTLPANIRHRQKGLIVRSALAYYGKK
jgi:hypothetical protein